MTTDTAIPMSAEPTTPPATATANTTTAAPAAAAPVVSKELKAIEAVADKVNGIERDLHALAERTTAYAANLCARLWQHQHHTTKATATAAADDTTPKATANGSATTTAAVRAVAYRLRMDTHWADEALMKCLFTLDNVFGDDTVKQQRKAQVSRIKQLIARAEALTVRLRRLEPLLKRLPAPPVAATEAAAVDTKTTADSKAEVKADTKATVEAPVAMETTTTTTTTTAPAAAAPADHLDHKHTPPAAPAAAARPASPPAAAAPTTKSRSPSPTPSTTTTSSSAGSAAAPAPGESSTSFVIPENVKAQWPRLRPEFETTSNPATGSIRLSADLSGVRDEDLSVSLSEHNTVLTVRGLLRPKPPVRRLVRRARPQQRRQASWWFGAYDDEYDEEEDQDVYEDEEQPFGWFEEQFTLPARLGLDATRAERRFVDGQLTIVLPRAQRPPSPPKAQPQPQSHYGYARQQPQYAHAAAAPRRAMYNPFFGGWF